MSNKLCEWLVAGQDKVRRAANLNNAIGAVGLAGTALSAAASVIGISKHQPFAALAIATTAVSGTVASAGLADVSRKNWVPFLYAASAELGTGAAYYFLSGQPWLGLLTSVMALAPAIPATLGRISLRRDGPAIG